MPGKSILPSHCLHHGVLWEETNWWLSRTSTHSSPSSHSHQALGASSLMYGCRLYSPKQSPFSHDTAVGTGPHSQEFLREKPPTSCLERVWETGHSQEGGSPGLRPAPASTIVNVSHLRFSNTPPGVTHPPLLSSMLPMVTAGLPSKPSLAMCASSLCPPHISGAQSQLRDKVWVFPFV